MLLDLNSLTSLVYYYLVFSFPFLSFSLHDSIFFNLPAAQDRETDMEYFMNKERTRQQHPALPNFLISSICIVIWVARKNIQTRKRGEKEERWAISSRTMLVNYPKFYLTNSSVKRGGEGELRKRNPYKKKMGELWVTAISIQRIVGRLTVMQRTRNKQTKNWAIQMTRRLSRGDEKCGQEFPGSRWRAM